MAKGVFGEGDRWCHKIKHLHYRCRTLLRKRAIYNSTNMGPTSLQWGVIQDFCCERGREVATAINHQMKTDLFTVDTTSSLKKSNKPPSAAQNVVGPPQSGNTIVFASAPTDDLDIPTAESTEHHEVTRGNKNWEDVHGTSR